MTTASPGPRPRIATGVLALLLAVSVLAACGAGGGSGDTPGGTDAAAAGGNAAGAEEGGADDLRFVYLSAPLGDPNYASVACGARIEAERLGVTVEHQESQDFTAASQIPVLNSVVATRPDGILISPTDAEGLIAPLAQVTERGIPVVTAVNTLNETSGVAAQVLVDNLGAGRSAARFIAEQADGREVSVAVLSFNAGQSRAADDEWRGFEEEIANYPNVTYLGPQFVGSDAASSTEAMNALLTQEPDLFGVFTAFGASAQGILASVRQRGVEPVIVSGYAAATAEVVDALRSGEMAAIVDFPFRDVGAAAVQQSLAAATGEPVEQTVSFESILYTRDSFDDPEQAGNLGAVHCPA